MIRFASVRRIILSGVPGWRCLQQTVRTPKAQLPFQSRPSSRSMPSTLTPTNVFRIRPVSWQVARLSHSDPQGTSGRGDLKQGFSLRALGQAPKPALYLGVSGLIPFLFAPLAMVATQSFYPELAYAQVVYGACIVSFLGGARWGFALPTGSPAQPDWMNLGNSVVPSLLAWLALLCKDSFAEGALVVIMGLGLSQHYDLTLLPGYPSWFKAMRTLLSLVATFSLVATLIMKEFHPEKKFKEILN
ncbi:transmembrane protein 69-like [Spinachia spinachia]